MNIKLVTTSEPGHPGWKQLERSLIAGGVPHHLMTEPWTGFGCKIGGVRKYLLGPGADVDIVIFLDGVDTFFLGSWEELAGRILDPGIYDGRGLFSCEKAVWPPSALIQEQYKLERAMNRPAGVDENREHNGSEAQRVLPPWHHLNSGGYIIGRAQFLAMTEGFDFRRVECDQSFFTACYLNHPFCDPNHGAMNRLREQAQAMGKSMKADIVLDLRCQIFQSIAFEGANEFQFTEQSRLFNRITGTTPSFIHGNGRTPMEKIYALRPHP